jgi:L-lysine 6-transaminase
VQQSLQIVEGCLQRYPGEVVGILVEPIQGAGGQRVAPKRFFQGLSELAQQYDVFLGFDEVQTAGGQTGTVFAVDQFDLPYPPQAIATAKKFGNGVMYMLQSMQDQGVLDSTWGGTLADMVRFVQEWKIVRNQRLIEEVPGKARVVVEGLGRLARRFPHHLFNVRGMGLYQGFSLRQPEDSGLLADLALQQEQMFLQGAGPGAIRLRPVLDVTVAEIELMLEKLERCLCRLPDRQTAAC